MNQSGLEMRIILMLLGVTHDNKEKYYIYSL